MHDARRLPGHFISADEQQLAGVTRGDGCRVEHGGVECPSEYTSTPPWVGSGRPAPGGGSGGGTAGVW